MTLNSASLWQKALTPDWLVGVNRCEFSQQVERRIVELQRLKHQGYPRILLAEPEPHRFLASFMAACLAESAVFLANPHWGQLERQQVLALVQPDCVWGSAQLWPVPSVRDPNTPTPVYPYVAVPTGGTSGQIRFALHTWETFVTAVAGFQQHFQVNRINAYCVLPLFHVSGLMQALRVLYSGGQLVVEPFKDFASRLTLPVNPQQFFLSLVPTQLQRLLKTSPPWLCQFQTILVGGGPTWPDLLQQARQHQLRLALTYGMTETAAQVATLWPEGFLRGETHCGQCLPHVQITLSEGNFCGQTGAIAIQTGALAWGYYPNLPLPKTLAGFQTDDLGFFDAGKNLHVVGRASNKIISGGENVFPAEVEAAIQSTCLVEDVCVIGLPNPDWGEIVIAVYVPRSTTVTNAMLVSAIAPQLSRYKHPKYWIAMPKLPRNDQGKINREQVRAIAQIIMI